LERVRSDIEAKKQIEVDQERAYREVTKSELEAEQKRDIRRRERIRARGQRYASLAMAALKILLLVVLALATVYSFGWGLPFLSGPMQHLVATSALLILLFFSMASFWNGTTLENATRHLEILLARWIERKLLALTE
jgi:cation transport ATPase